MTIDRVEDHRVDEGEGVVAVLLQDGPCVAVRVRGQRYGAKRPRVLVDHRKDRQRDSSVASRADSLVIAKLGEGFADHRLRDENRGARVASSDDMSDSPAVMAIASIDRGDEKAAVGEGAQRP